MEYLKAVFPSVLDIMFDLSPNLRGDIRIEAFPDSIRTITDRPYLFEKWPTETPVEPWRLRLRRKVARRRRRNQLRRQTRRLQRPNPYPRRIRNSWLTRLAWDQGHRRRL